jgi:hypothetical protein
MTRDQINSVLHRSTLAVCRAMVILLSRQTTEEQMSHTTRHSNGRGFNYRDAEYGTYLAHYILCFTTSSYTSWQQSKKPTADQVSQVIAHYLASVPGSVGTVLTGYHLGRAREMATYYSGQLLQVAEQRKMNAA